jgi:RHS repeat-associated protein
MTYNGRDGVVSLGGGHYWMTHRIHASQQGRFVSADPVEAKNGSTQSTYNYEDGDPVNFFDPTGLWVNVAARAVWAILARACKKCKEAAAASAAAAKKLISRLASAILAVRKCAISDEDKCSTSGMVRV